MLSPATSSILFRVTEIFVGHDPTRLGLPSQALQCPTSHEPLYNPIEKVARDALIMTEDGSHSYPIALPFSLTASSSTRSDPRIASSSDMTLGYAAYTEVLPRSI